MVTKNSGHRLSESYQICVCKCVGVRERVCHPACATQSASLGFLGLSERRKESVPFMVSAQSVFLVSLGCKWWMSDHTIVCASGSVVVHFFTAFQQSVCTCMPLHTQDRAVGACRDHCDANETRAAVNDYFYYQEICHHFPEPKAMS